MEEKISVLCYAHTLSVLKEYDSKTNDVSCSRSGETRCAMRHRQEGRHKNNKQGEAERERPNEGKGNNNPYLLFTPVRRRNRKARSL